MGISLSTIRFGQMSNARLIDAGDYDGEALAFVPDAMPVQGIVVERPFPVLEVDTGDVEPLVVDAAGQQATVYLHQLLGAMEIEPGPLAERVGHALAWVTVQKAAAKNHKKKAVRRVSGFSGFAQVLARRETSLA